MRLIKTLLLIALSCFCSLHAQANHIFGIDFYYEHVSGNNYRIHLVIYGDCDNKKMPQAAFNNLASATPEIEIYNSTQLQGRIRLNLTGNPTEVTPVCSALKNSTVCSDLSSSIPGVVQFHYTGVYNLNATSKNWHFKFNGSLVPNSAGRSATITNISPAGSTIVALDAMLDNSSAPNSSATFTTIPTPFYCINVPQNYNPGAIDANNDSLNLSLITALSATGSTPVSYISPATATAPLTTATGSFSFNNSTGQMSFTPNAVQRSLVVQQVQEYRNGTLVGTAMREMTVVILGSCNNTPPTISFDSSNSYIRGAVRANGNIVNICYKTDSSRFRMSAANPANDTIEATVTGLPGGAVANIKNNKTPNPSIEIEWNLPGLLPGNYNFFVTYKTDGCPLASVQTQAYTVAVIRPNSITSLITAPTQCVRKATVQFNLSNGLLPRHVDIAQNGSLIGQYTDNTGTFTDSLAAGNYVVTVTSPKLGCATTMNLRVADSGQYPNLPVVDTTFYCFNDVATAITAKADSGAILKWYTIEGNALMGAPTPRTDTAGAFLWLVAQQYKTCRSLTDTVRAYVTQRPTADFTLPTTICEDDTATFAFSGSIGVGPILNYDWDFDGGIVKSGADKGPWKIYWHSPGSKTIKLTVAENKCTSAETQHNLTVQHRPYAGFDVRNETCQFDTLQVSYNSKPFTGQTYAWKFQDADTATATGPGPYVQRWHKAGIKTISLTVDLSGCSDTRSAQVTIHPAPDAHILNAAGPVCVGDKIYLKASGGVSYAWTPEDSIMYTASGELYAQILKPIEYKVQVLTEYGCPDSAAIRYDVVEPCCQFSYPNAFSPNGDGRNDRFRVVTHGNSVRYELSVYNNWGQRVYYGLDPEEGWDGTFRGKVCDPGTYFYYLNATCFTGRQETHRGDLVLVR